MPADVKPLFRADALRPKLGRFVWPEYMDAAALRKFVYLLGAERVLPAAGLGHLDDLLAEQTVAKVGQTRRGDW